PQRIAADDVQQLLRRTEVTPDTAFTIRFPAEMPSAVSVRLSNGETLSAEASAYDGFVTQPLDRAGALAKFNRLVVPFAGEQLAEHIADTVFTPEERPLADLITLLARVPRSRGHAAAAA